MLGAIFFINQLLIQNEWEHFGVKLERRLSRGGIVSSEVLEIRNWDMGHGKQEMGHGTWEIDLSLMIMSVS